VSKQQEIIVHRDSSACILTTLQAGRPSNRGCISGRDKKSFPSLQHSDWLWDPSKLLLKLYRAFFLGGKANGAWSLTVFLHLDSVFFFPRPPSSWNRPLKRSLFILFRLPPALIGSLTNFSPNVPTLRNSAFNVNMVWMKNFCSGSLQWNSC
jgi:hypothetical protein